MKNPGSLNHKRSITLSRKRAFKWIAYTLGGFLLFLMILFILVYAGLFGKLATVEELKYIQNHLSSEIYSNEKVLLGKYYYQDRTNVQYQDLPEHLIHALIATEDARFYEHNGIDRRSALRVIFKSILLQQRGSGGGSTLHQQLAKNLYPRKDYSIISMPVNKFREMILGVRLGNAYSKAELLELYLNTVSFGENTYGIETASLRFFSKLPSELKPEESALLVGMLKATYNYNPRYFPERSKERRNLVLNQMVKYQYLSHESCDSLQELPIKLQYVNHSHNEGLAPYFREHLRQVLLDWTKENPREDGTPYNIYTDGLKIYTTINADLQRYAEESVRTHMAHLQKIFDRQWGSRIPWGNQSWPIRNFLEETAQYKDLSNAGLNEEQIMDSLKVPRKMEIFTWEGMKEMEISEYDAAIHYARFLHAGLLSMEAKTGFVRAWVGGINSTHFQYDHVTSRRQAGSTFKPVLYAEALRNGHDPCIYMANDSIVYEEYDDWTPRNANGEYGGYYSMKGALAHSVNTISVKLLEETGIDEVVDFAQQLGFKEEMPATLSLALGTGNVSLVEMVRAYTMFMNEGRTVEPIFLRRIEDKQGKVLYESETQYSAQHINKYQAQLMTEMMKSVVDTGTASSLRSMYGFTNEIAGKTGTTQHNTDGWFIGYTPVLITGVWVGGDLPSVRFRYGGYGQGSYAALPIWARYMQKINRDPLYRYSKELSFEIPEYVQAALECEEFLESDDQFRQERRRTWIRRFIRSGRERRNSRR